MIESDSGVDNPSGGETEIDNAGTIEKTAGIGTSTILVNGTLSNTGTIEADSGTLNLAATIAQVSQGTLAAGTWNARNGSTLSFPSGTSITTNQGSITLDDARASFPAIKALSASSGAFEACTNGAWPHDRRREFSNTGGQL